MKRLALLLVISAVSVSAQSTNYTNFIRQTQQQTQVAWDMPVAVTGTGPSALPIEGIGSLFQLWTIDQTAIKDYLLDQKLVGAYVPKADIKIIAPDSFEGTPWTRIDKPFSVEITVSGLLSGIGLPLAATKVLQERHIKTYPVGSSSFSPNIVTSQTPLSFGYIETNGKTQFQNIISKLKPNPPGDATTASGEEHFVVHALSDGSITQTQIASAYIKVWPMASGSISGIAKDDELRFKMPTLQLSLVNLYPRSATRLMLYEGSTIDGVEGKLIKDWRSDPEKSECKVLQVTELADKIGADGPYTLVLTTEDIYSRYELCDAIPFTVRRTMEVNAMQVNFAETSEVSNP